MYTLHLHFAGVNSWKNISEDWVAREDWEETVENLLPGTEYKIRLFVKNSKTGQE